MSAPRIEPIEPPYAAEVQADFDKIMRGAPPLLFCRTVARNPRVLQRMLASNLLDRGSISLRAREVMTLRTCARCGAEYEWGVHVAMFGEKAQLTPEQTRSSVHGSPKDACWSTEDRLVLELADQLHDTNRVDDSHWLLLSQHFQSEQLIELIALAGVYHAVSYLVNACRVKPEAFAARFPSAA